MDAKQIISFLSNSDLLAQQDYQELKSLVLEYPYCANLHLLLLEKSVLENHPDLEKNLSRAAITGIDRHSLRLKMQEWEARLREERGLEELPLREEGGFIPPTEVESDPSAGGSPAEPEVPGAGTPSAEDESDQTTATAGTSTPRVPSSEPDMSGPAEDDLNFNEGVIARKLARESLTESDQFASELLAGLLAKQGNIDKAILMYEQLRLKMPEKSDYFAAKIEELKS